MNPQGIRQLASSSLLDKLPYDLVPAIMAGFIGIEFIPNYNLLLTGEGSEFLQRFRALPPSQMANACVLTVDNTASGTHYLYSKSDGITCAGVKSFSSLDFSTVDPFAPHAYDAAYCKSLP